MSEREHGYARYKLDGCRCYTCGWAVAQYNDAREHAIRRGEWQPFVDAAPVRDHLLRLRACSLGLRRVAAIAKVDRKRLQAVLNGRPERGTGPQEQVRPALAVAVLQVEPTLENLGSATPINSLGTLRRLQALAAAGWPQSRLADRLGVTDQNFGGMLCRPMVTVRTARKAIAIYDELWLSDPRTCGVGAQAYSRARNHGAAMGWAPPGAWDEDALDDPGAFPDWTGQCGTPQGYRTHERLGLPTCAPCRAARAAVQRERRAAA
ncbi:hypothetical protein [Streptomyces cyaneofuscatus]|uniref:hypothetical protein n=1 Tax=Streptomyces cyaneofuscatus TaxID=66883 RepID=UPI0013DD5CA5|nr:hypothetical protein [Streptomyces cyaneofuscatus]NDZ63601.1 hypothetical protein [Streptomyces cyaneofuscatus]